MLFIIYGSQSAMVKNRLRKIIRERLPESDEMNLVRLDMDGTSIYEAIDEASSMPLGYETKMVVMENCQFLKKKYSAPKDFAKDYDKQVKELERYLLSPNEGCDLAMVLLDDDIDQKSAIYQTVLKDGKVFQLLPIGKDDWGTYITRYFNDSLGIRIDRDAVQELSTRVHGDLNLFVNEAAKLALYTDHVTFNDVCLMVNRPLDDNAFLLYNHLMNGRNQDAIALWRDLADNGAEPVQLVAMLGNQFRLLLEIIHLSKRGMDNDAIAKELDIKEIRVKIMRKNAYAMSEARLRDTLEALYTMDINIKSGLTDRFYAFESFLINFKTR